MQKFYLILLLILISSCTSLTKQERNHLRILKSEGVTVNRPLGNFERPANPAAAGANRISELIYCYQYDRMGKTELAKNGIKLELE